MKITEKNDLSQENVEMGNFLCPDMKGITFRYALSAGWHTQKTESSMDGCKIFLNWEWSIMPSLPSIYIDSIPMDDALGMTDIQMNQHGIRYSRKVERVPRSDERKWFIVSDETYFYVSDKVIRVGLELYSEAGLNETKLDRELFWKNVIQSFQEVKQEVGHQDAQ